MAWLKIHSLSFSISFWKKNKKTKRMMKTVGVNCTKKRCKLHVHAKKKKSMTLPPAGHVCCRLSHTKESHDTEGGGWTEQWQNSTSDGRLNKIIINQMHLRPTFLALRFIHVLLHCGRLQSLCLYLVWSSLKPLASSQHSVRVCVYVGGCVCVGVFFPSLQMMEAQGSPCFNAALSLATSSLL